MLEIGVSPGTYRKNEKRVVINSKQTRTRGTPQTPQTNKNKTRPHTRPLEPIWLLVGRMPQFSETPSLRSFWLQYLRTYVAIRCFWHKMAQGLKDVWSETPMLLTTADHEPKNKIWDWCLPYSFCVQSLSMLNNNRSLKGGPLWEGRGGNNSIDQACSKLAFRLEPFGKMRRGAINSKQNRTRGTPHTPQINKKKRQGLRRGLLNQDGSLLEGCLRGVGE